MILWLATCSTRTLLKCADTPAISQLVAVVDEWDILIEALQELEGAT
jgi:hypothetical protein